MNNIFELFQNERFDFYRVKLEVDLKIVGVIVQKKQISRKYDGFIRLS
jgi:hypothetical protein